MPSKHTRKSTLLVSDGLQVLPPAFLWFATIQCIKSKQDLTGLAPKSCFVAGETIEREIGQIGQAQEAARNVDGTASHMTARGCRAARAVFSGFAGD